MNGSEPTFFFLLTMKRKAAAEQGGNKKPRESAFFEQHELQDISKQWDKVWGSQTPFVVKGQADERAIMLFLDRFRTEVFSKRFQTNVPIKNRQTVIKLLKQLDALQSKTPYTKGPVRLCFRKRVSKELSDGRPLFRSTPKCGVHETNKHARVAIQSSINILNRLRPKDIDPETKELICVFQGIVTQKCPSGIFMI